MRRFFRALFEIAWKATSSLMAIGGHERPTDQELGDAQAAQSRRISQVSASPADRDLAGALIRTRDLPRDLEERWRTWTPVDPTTPVVVSARQMLAQRKGRLRRGDGAQLLLELRRYWSDEAASEAMATPPTRTLPDGRRMRERPAADNEDLRIYEWNRRENGNTVESVLELRLQRGSAAAVLLAQCNAPTVPTVEWERQTIDLMRTVGERLR